MIIMSKDKLSPAEVISNHISYWQPVDSVFNPGEIVKIRHNYLIVEYENGDIAIARAGNLYKIVSVVAEPSIKKSSPADDTVIIKYWMYDIDSPFRIFCIEDKRIDRSQSANYDDWSMSDNLKSTMRNNIRLRNKTLHQKHSEIEIGSIYKICKWKGRIEWYDHIIYSCNAIVTNKGVINDKLHLEFNVLDSSFHGKMCVCFTGSLKTAYESFGFGTHGVKNGDDLQIIPVELVPHDMPVACID